MAGGRFGGGVGSFADPFLIEDADDLNQIRNHLGSYFKLTTNINLGVPPYNSNGGWNPISGNFSGQLNGNGFKIVNLYINRPNEDYVGLFRQIYINGATVTKVIDLGFENADITARNRVGILAGYVYFDNTASFSFTCDTYGIIARCYFKGTVRGYGLTGGVFGDIYWNKYGSWNTWYPVTDTKVQVSVIATAINNYYGLLAGRFSDQWGTSSNGSNSNLSYFAITNSVFIGTIKAADGLTGTLNYTSPIIYGTVLTNSNRVYLDTTLWTDWVNSEVTGYSTAQLQNPANFSVFMGERTGYYPTWNCFANRYPQLYFENPDYFFVCADGKYMTYDFSASNWVEFPTIGGAAPARLDAIAHGMKVLENIPQAGWDKLKPYTSVEIVDILEKAEQATDFTVAFNYTQDSSHDTEKKTTFRKTVNFASYGDSMVEIY